MYFVSVILLLRDCDKYVQYLNEKFSELEVLYKNSIQFEYYMYENDSTDNTKKEIQQFFKNKKGKYLFENIKDSYLMSGISTHRGKKMAILRNNLKKFHGTLKTDFVLLIDSDVIFLEDSIIKMINDIINIENSVMVTPYCICWDWYSQSEDNNHYYDSFAVITNDNINYEINDNTCMFENCEKCKAHRKNKNIHLNCLLSNNSISKVRSAFGSFALIKTAVYNKVFWEHSICEHHSFCNNVRKYGDIIINPNITTITTIPEKRNYHFIQIALKGFVEKKIIDDDNVSDVAVADDEDVECDEEDVECDDEDVECDEEDVECDEEDVECDDEDVECDDEDVECDDEDVECDDEDVECDEEDVECDDEDVECDDEEVECDDEDVECDDEDVECDDEEVECDDEDVEEDVVEDEVDTIKTENKIIVDNLQKADNKRENKHSITTKVNACGNFLEIILTEEKMREGLNIKKNMLVVECFVYTLDHAKQNQYKLANNILSRDLNKSREKNNIDDYKIKIDINKYKCFDKLENKKKIIKLKLKKLKL